jgi:hypothetical protein
MCKARLYRACRVRVPLVTEFVEWLTGTHKCACGAKYKVTVTQTPAARISCEKCGTVMDHPAAESRLAYERITSDK